MFNNVINLNRYVKSKIREDFLPGLPPVVSGGNKTSIDASTKINKNFENNQKIDRSMLVESVTKLVNNIASDVIQQNTAIAASAAGASNLISVSGVKCKNVSISNVNQTASAINETQVKAQQQNTSKIANEISSNIDKTIEKIGSTDLAALQAENTKQLNAFMNDVPGYDPNKAQQLKSQCGGGGSLLSVNNKCDIDASYELDATVKQSLELDESFKINDQDDISNEIKSKVEQTNFAECKATATAENKIIIDDIICGGDEDEDEDEDEDDEDKSKPIQGKLKIDTINQDAKAKVLMTCIFDQKNVSEITNKIVNKISKRYNQIYDAVQKKGETKGQDWLNDKMKKVDALAGAGVEQIRAAAGNLPKADKTSNTGSQSNTSPTGTNDSSVTDMLPPISDNSSNEPSGNTSPNKPSGNTSSDNSSNKPSGNSSNKSSDNSSNKPSGNSSTDTSGAQQTQQPSMFTSLISNPYIFYGGIAFFIFIIIIIIIMIMMSGSKTKRRNNND